jgi:DNA phosphorothioation-associated putative methyltransferase
MKLSEYQKSVSDLAFGKQLPTAVYVYWGENADFGKELNLLVAMLAARHELGTQFNVIKFRTDELKLSFLSYPQFMEDPHPALRHAVTIDLVTGKARQTDYTNNHNPPILHRKETFLPENHPARATFEALTRAEEAVGLYEHTATIGFKLNWEQLLAKKGVEVDNHTVRQVMAKAEKEAPPNRFFERHKTALTRYE